MLHARSVESRSSKKLGAKRGSTRLNELTLLGVLCSTWISDMLPRLKNVPCSRQHPRLDTSIKDQVTLYVANFTVLAPQCLEPDLLSAWC